MIYVLDTDHLSLLGYEDSVEAPCIRRRILELPPDDVVVTTVISFEEQMRGWMAKLKLVKSFHAEVAIYARLLVNFNVFRKLTILRFDDIAASQAELFRKQKLRIGTMDLKIAAIALSNGAILVTRNRVDFIKVDGLRIEDWSREM